MSSPRDSSLPNDEAIETMAASWLVQKEEGFSPAEAAEFERWRNAHPKHAAAVAMLEETCGLLEKLPLVEDQLTAASSPPVSPRSEYDRPRRNVIRFPAVVKIAMALAACAVIALAVWRLQPERDTFAQAYATATGGFQRVVLPDASVIELNANSAVRVQFSEKSRRVTLTTGEAHFTVAKNAARPFVVGAGKVTVRAVGTAFNVRLDEARVQVLVTEGRVRVSQEAMADALAFSSQASTAEAPLLEAGQRVTVPISAATPALPAVASLNADAVRAALEWQNPLLVFANRPLREVVQQFNRYNRVQLEIADDDLAARPVAGQFHANQVETFVSLFERSRDFSAERVSAERIVLRKTGASSGR